MSRRRIPLLVQAPIQPLDEDGVLASVVGTVVFAIAAVACLLGRGWLDAHGMAWWTWVCVTGLVVGLAMIGYTVRRRSRRPRTS